MTIEITGIKNIQNKLKLTKNDVRQALSETGLVIEGDSKRYCTWMGAVDTGRFRASISTALDGAAQKDMDSVIPPISDPRALAVLRIGSSVDYATYVINGTKNMVGRDCFTPAVYNNINFFGMRLNQIISNK